MSIVRYQHPDGEVVFDSHAGILRWTRVMEDSRVFSERLSSRPGANGVESIRLGFRSKVIRITGFALVNADEEGELQAQLDVLQSRANGKTGTVTIRGGTQFAHCIMRVELGKHVVTSQGIIQEYTLVFESRGFIGQQFTSSR